MKDNSLDAVTRGQWEYSGLIVFQGNSRRSLGSVSPAMSGDCHLMDAFRDGTKPLHLLWFWSALVQHCAGPSPPCKLWSRKFLPSHHVTISVAALAGGNAAWLSVTCSLQTILICIDTHPHRQVGEAVAPPLQKEMLLEDTGMQVSVFSLRHLQPNTYPVGGKVFFHYFPCSLELFLIHG